LFQDQIQDTSTACSRATRVKITSTQATLAPPFCIFFYTKKFFCLLKYMPIIA